MSRLVTLLAVLAIVCTTLAVRPAHAKTVPSGKRVAVLIWLEGSPLGANPSFRARTARTHYHNLLDPALPAARWYSAKMLTYQQQEVAYLQSRHIDVRVIRYFNILFNGISATVPTSQLSRLRQAVNVTRVTRQHMYKPLLDKSIGLIHAQQAWPVVGGEAHAGKGVFIAQIDTGIDINNPCFSDKGMPAPPAFLRGRGDPKFENNKVVVARAYPINPGDKVTPADTDGHGTFGAAIEACDYNTKTPVGTQVSGVAPAAYLMNYNVFPAYPNTETPSLDTVLPALEDAVSDGADVVNLSLGYDFGADDYRLNPEEQAIEVAIRNGVTVVVSAGNAGPEMQSVTSPSAAADAISVGATTNAHALHTSVKIGGPTAPPASLSLIQDAPSEYRFSSPVGPAQIVPAGYGRMPGDPLPPGEPSNSNTVDDFAGKDFHGKIALIERGKRNFVDKIANAKKAGAVGAIVYDSNPAGYELLQMPNNSNFPAVFISYKDGTALLQWVTDHPDATATFDPTINFYDETPNLLTDFSSRGYGPNYSIKPDVVAPGQGIYSAAESEYPPDKKTANTADLYDPSGFATADGTSFSAPHTTGTAALVKGLHPTWTPLMIKATILNTAQMNVHEEATPSQISSVMESGSGLVDAQAAVNANAYLLPSTVSFGAVNRAYGPVQQAIHVTLHDATGGVGTWQGKVSWVDGASGVSLSVPSSISLPANGSTDISLQLSVSTSAAAGNYDGYAVFTKGDETLHVPFFVHVATTAVKKGSVLLVDDTWSRFQAPYPLPPIKHVDVARYYTDAVSRIGETYSYWPENTQGTPSLSDMRRASAVIYFTGSNVNDFSSENSNSESLQGPITATDSSILHQYLAAGGHVFITGEGAVLSVPLFMGYVLGVIPDLTSLYDTDTNDFAHTGTVSPPKPSTYPDSGTLAYKRVGPFLGLKPLDLSSKGDGARTNLAQYSQLLGDFVGVSGLQPIRGNNVDGLGPVYGQFAMAAPKKLIPAKSGLQETGVTASDEPTMLNPKVGYKGRSVVFSFGFEGINNNTGYSTREQVLKRIFQWFNDKPSATVVPVHYRPGKKVTLRARVKSNVGAKGGAYQWQIGLKTLGATSKPTTFRFPHAGTFRARVLVTDTMGHAAMSRWVKLRVG